MKVLIAGGTGLVGKALRASLEQDGHTCLVLSRSRSENTVYWNPQEGQIDTAALAGIDAVVNLSGRDIGCRWTDAVKDEIISSRVASTDLLARTLATLHPAPSVLINASATGYYGTAPEGEVSEQAPLGDGFLASVCARWEAATQPATDAGIRTVLLRTGVVIAPDAGAVKKLLPVFKAGLGGPVGSGGQWMSWIALEDLTGLIRFALTNDSLSGPLNAVAPQPVTNAAFATALGSALGKPSAIRVPAMVLRLSFGQMAEETVLSSARISAAKALTAGYRYRFPTLEEALRHQLSGQR